MPMCCKFLQETLQKFLNGVPFKQQLQRGASAAPLDARKGNKLLQLSSEGNRVTHSTSLASSSPSQNPMLANSLLVYSMPLTSEFSFSRLLSKVLLRFAVNIDAMELTHVPLCPVG